MFKIKYLFIILYIILISVFSLKTIQIMGIDFYENITLKSFQNKIFELTENDFKKLLIYMLFFAFIWTLMLGFISPILLMAGYLISPIYGALVVSLANAISGTILIYFIANNF